MRLCGPIEEATVARGSAHSSNRAAADVSTNNHGSVMEKIHANHNANQELLRTFLGKNTTCPSLRPSVLCILPTKDRSVTVVHDVAQSRDDDDECGLFDDSVSTDQSQKKPKEIRESYESVLNETNKGGGCLRRRRHGSKQSTQLASISCVAPGGTNTVHPHESMESDGSVDVGQVMDGHDSDPHQDMRRAGAKTKGLLTYNPYFALSAYVGDADAGEHEMEHAEKQMLQHLQDSFKLYRGGSEAKKKRRGKSEAVEQQGLLGALSDDGSF